MIQGFQHVGIGVSNIDRSFDFYRKLLGFSIKLNDHEEAMEQMVPIIGSLESMRVIMATNLSGGAAVELVQHTSSKPRPMPKDFMWGDLGYIAMGCKAYGLEDLYGVLKEKGVDFLTGVIEFEVSQGGTWRSAFLKDPDGLVIELLETAELRVSGGRPRVGGFSHVTLGVSDMERSLDFFKRIAGYDLVIVDSDKTPGELDPVTGGGSFRRVTLKRSRRPRGTLPLEGGMVVLVEAKERKGKPIFQDRRWGDVGIMEMAFDVSEVGSTYSGLVEDGAEPFCEPTMVDMGMGSVGTFAYVKDPDGNTVELVEVDKLGFLPPRVVGPILSAVLRLRSKF